MKKVVTITLLLTILLLLIPNKSFGVSASDGILLNDVDDPFSTEELLDMVIALDLPDGNITSLVTITTDEYTGNESTLGDYLIVFSVTDADSNTTTLSITIRNVDVTAPVLELPDGTSENITHYVSSGYSINSNMPSISATDNIDGDITSSLVITGIESVDTNTIGEYIINYVSTDSSGNISTIDVTISVVDGAVAPIIPAADNAPIVVTVIVAAIAVISVYFFYFRKK